MLNIRIKERRLQLGLKQNQLAKKIGIAATNISMWESGATSPKGENLIRLANALKVAPEWILYGGEVEPGNRELAQAEYLMIDIPPLFDNTGPKYFPRAQLETQNLDLESLYWMPAPDDSMSPSVREGDVLVVDMHDREVKDGKVYIVRYADALIIKRLFKRINGLLLRSDDTAAVPDETLSPNKQDAIEVVGRVVLRIGEL